MDFEILSDITDIKIIAVNTSIHNITRLRRQYGVGRWRKLKGVATVMLKNGTIHVAELHWYEAHGIGRKEFKIKFPLFD